MVFRIKQYIKMLLQNVCLPAVYRCFRRTPVQKGLVLFADAHHDGMPFSMRRTYEELIKLQQAQDENGAASGLVIETFTDDFAKLSFRAMVKYLISFMRRYAQAEYVVICDYFLPVSSCRKRPETKVIQLWHSCGLMKRIAFDAGDDIPKNYRGDLFGNYTYLTLSAEICVPVHARALRLPQERIVASGVSRTDYYFDKQWNERCMEQFYVQCPQAKGKKVAVWAPTFRGNAAMPTLEGLDAVRQAAKELEEDWFFVIRAHPHLDAHGTVSNCALATEELFPVADVLITDYSSVLFDYLLYDKPAVLFAPDLGRYEKQRGFYLNYREIPFPLVEQEERLVSAVQECDEWMRLHREEIQAFRRTYVGACDGHATERILKLAGITGAAEKEGV